MTVVVCNAARKVSRTLISFILVIAIFILPLNQTFGTPTAYGEQTLLECLSNTLNLLIGDHRFKKIDSDPINQWLFWEERANTALYKDTTNVIPIQVKIGSLSKQYPYKQKLHILENLDDTNSNLKSMFLDQDIVKVPRHPFTTKEHALFKDLETSTITLNGRLTASRSIAFKENGHLFSIKMPTDFPHKSHRQDSKMQMWQDISSGMTKSKFILQKDKMYKKNLFDDVVILPEVLAITNLDGEGILVRDLQLLQDGNYYFPAQSIPYAGYDIAKKNNQDFASFWQENFFKKAGALQAKLFLKYGLNVDTPNPQNFLIQLDKNLKPTGKIFLRDLSDTSFVKHWLEINNENEILAKIDEMGDLKDRTYPTSGGGKILFKMDEGNISKQIQQEWEIAHNLEFATTLCNELQITIPQDIKNDHFKIFFNLLFPIYKTQKQGSGKEFTKKYREWLQRNSISN